MIVHELTAEQARRTAVRAQLLSAPPQVDLHQVVRHLSLVQVEPTAAVAPSAEVVMWSRLGGGYRLGDLDRARTAGSLVELQGRLRPAEDIALFRAEMRLWRDWRPGFEWPAVVSGGEWRDSRCEWVLANDDTRRDILEKLYDEGPLPSRELPDTTLVPFESSGWNNNRNIRMLLGLMVRRGEVALAGYDGRDALWDLAERVYPDDPPIPLEEAARVRSERRLRSLGIARVRSAKTPDEPDDLGPVGEPAVVEGIRGRWRLDPSYLDQDFSGRTVLLSPLDRLVHDRKRMTDLFGFDYQLEMYKPASRRRWGYWAMPILSGDRLVGKLDATAERDAGVLRVDAIHWDEPVSATIQEAVQCQVDRLADWLGLHRDG